MKCIMRFVGNRQEPEENPSPQESTPSFSKTMLYPVAGTGWPYGDDWNIAHQAEVFLGDWGKSFFFEQLRKS